MSLAYEVSPGIGMGPVKLGMSRDEARAVMGSKPVTFNKGGISRYDTDAYHENGFQIFYAGDEPKVEYIELSRDCDFTALYRIFDVFNTKAEDLVEFISQDTPYDKNDPELGYSYIFPELEMTLWRPILPYEEDDEDGEDGILEDESEGQFFSTIGIGIKGYYSSPQF